MTEIEKSEKKIFKLLLKDFKRKSLNYCCDVYEFFGIRRKCHVCCQVYRDVSRDYVF